MKKLLFILVLSSCRSTKQHIPYVRDNVGCSVITKIGSCNKQNYCSAALDRGQYVKYINSPKVGSIICGDNKDGWSYK